MGLPYMPISWGGARGFNVGSIYSTPMCRVWGYRDGTRQHYSVCLDRPVERPEH